MLWKVSWGVDHQYVTELPEHMLCPRRNASFRVPPAFWFLPRHAVHSGVVELINSVQQILY